VVSKPGSESSDAVASGSEPQESEETVVGAEEAVSTDDEQQAKPPATPSGPQLASRGEPVVRQILGGELIGEEILEEMSGQGEADV